MNRIVSAISFTVWFLLTIACQDKRYPGPLTPEEALRDFRIREGFSIELFAAEPEIMDPVEMVFDELGNVYVAEMPDYPYMPEGDQGAGRIKVLQDTDGDGRVDRTVIFADSILEVTSMLPWKGGLIVTAAPNILYLKDNDGDMRADETEILFSGFFDNNSEAQITSLRYGIDNWIYAANNGQAGQVKFHRNPDAPALDMGGSDFRFRLDKGEFELESGGAQFGHTIDDWGNRFITQNTLHIRQVVIPWRYLHRNGVALASNQMLNISDHDLEMFQLTPPPYWRAERTRRRQEQYKEQGLDRVEYAEDHFTGCSGGTIYDGDAFPPEFYGNVFTGEVAGNLVHRDILVRADSSPVRVAQRAEDEKDQEFLATTDSWFRPAAFTVGPDGYLYVIDMYRQHIETPLSIPEDLKEDMDFLAGSERGRIYRILPEGASDDQKAAPMLTNESTQRLIELLAHPNRWWRLQAQRLLVERQDEEAVQPAKKMFETHEDPRARLHALYVLEGLNALNPTVVRHAMHDEHWGMRKHGLVLAERYSELPDILSLTNDPSLEVVMQASLSAGGFNDKRVEAALAAVINAQGKDPFIRAAVQSSVINPVSLLETLIGRGLFKMPEPWKISFVQDFGYRVGAKARSTDVKRFLQLLKHPGLNADDRWQVAAAQGLTKGLSRSEATSPEIKAWSKDVKVTNKNEADAALTEVEKLFTVL